MEKLLDFLFPPRCAFCHRLDRSGVCEACKRSLPTQEKPLREFSFGRVAAPLYYTGAVREAVLRLKFRSGLSTLPGFAALMAECAVGEFSGEFDTVAFVPVSKKRKRSRGYDQSERLAHEIAKRWNAKAERLLVKTRHTPPQSELSDRAGRQANVFGVYEAVNAEKIRGARILLVDDVVTTGATLRECVRELKDAGAQSVVCVALAAAEGKDAPTCKKSEK